MATLSSLGVGSGLDATSIVSQLMAAERQPLTALTTKQSSYQSKLTAYGTVSSGLSQFRDALATLSSSQKLQSVTTTPADATLLSATGGTGAVPGEYSVEIKQLAQAHRLASTGQASATAAIGSSESVVTFDFGNAADSSTFAGNKQIILAAGSSLADMRDAINNAGLGVKANIVNNGSGTPYQLTLSSSQAGAANSMRITVAGDSAVSDLLSYDPAGTKQMSQTIAAQDALLDVNGVSVTKTSNTVSDVVPGVTLTLKKTNVGDPTTLSVAYDTAAVNTAVTGFVDAYNKISKSIKDISSYNTTTKTAATLYGDSAMRSIRNQLRSVVTSALGGSGLTRLNQIGIEMQTDGTLKLNSSKLKTAIDTQFDQLPALFATSSSGSKGFAAQLDDLAAAFLDSDGILSARTDGINSSLKKLDNDKLRIEARLAIVQKQYEKQFSALDTTMSKMNSTASYLTQQLASLANM